MLASYFRIRTAQDHVERREWDVAAEELGPWDPLRPEDADAEFATWAAPWWVAGGWAIDMILGRQTREHGDLDLLVLRRDQACVREELLDWDVHAADPPGSLRPWPVGETLPPAVHDVWCRRTPRSAWAFQLMIDDTEGDDLAFSPGPPRPAPGVTPLAGHPLALASWLCCRPRSSSCTRARGSVTKTSPTSRRCVPTSLLTNATGCGRR